MLNLLALACALIVGLVVAERLTVPEHLKGPAAILMRTCQMESGLTNESIALARTGELPTDREFKCHLDCMLDKVGLFDDNHNIDPSIVWHVMPDFHKPKIGAVMEACKTIHGDDRCETAFLTLKCYRDTDPDVDITEWFTHD